MPGSLILKGVVFTCNSGITALLFKKSRWPPSKGIECWIPNYDMPAKMISEIVGHVDAVMVDRVYTHLKKNENAKAFIRRIHQVDSQNPKHRVSIPAVNSINRLLGME